MRLKTRVITSVVGLGVLALVLCFFDTLVFNVALAAVVLIAHHGATIAMADSAVVLEKGSVVEQGLISELAGRDSGYLSGMTGQR